MHSIQRISPWTQAMTLRSALDRLFDENLVRPGEAEVRSGFVPAADAWEDDDQITIRLAVPGVETGSVDVTFEQGTLTVSGNVGSVDGANGHLWVLREMPTGRFQRRFTLNVDVDADAAHAKVENGLVILSLPKRAEVKPRKIQVNVA